mmetsp:Transcript_1710/g.5031  ORF Transcript_1710/g.5031 Transcript_1710/m.5031 type:complete len:261 (+) Transcript_1710:344-1126(+)
MLARGLLGQGQVADGGGEGERDRRPCRLLPQAQRELWHGDGAPIQSHDSAANLDALRERLRGVLYFLDNHGVGQREPHRRALDERSLHGAREHEKHVGPRRHWAHLVLKLLRRDHHGPIYQRDKFVDLDALRIRLGPEHHRFHPKVLVQVQSRRSPLFEPYFPHERRPHVCTRCWRGTRCRRLRHWRWTRGCGGASKELLDLKPQLDVGHKILVFQRCSSDRAHVVALKPFLDGPPLEGMAVTREDRVRHHLRGQWTEEC